MPQYDYECRKCKKPFTVQQSFSDHDRDPRPKCPKCGSEQVERVFSAVQVKTTKKS